MSRGGAAVLIAAGLLFWGIVPAAAQTQDPQVETPPPVQAESGERTPLWAQNPAGEAPPVTGTSSTFTILRMLAVLALAALAVYGVVFFIKKASRPPAERDPYLRVLARVSLGGSSSASVLALGSQAWIVGASEGGVSLIAEVAEGETLDAMLLAESERAGEAGRLKLPGFHALLRKLRQNTPPPPGPNIESIRQRRDRLKGL